MVKSLLAMQETWVWSWGLGDPLEKDSTQVFLPGKSPGWSSLSGYSPWSRKESDRTERLTLSLSPVSSAGKESTWYAGDPSSAPGSERSSGEGIGYPLQYSWASLVAQLVMNLPSMRKTWVQSLGWEGNGFPWRGEQLPAPLLGRGEFHGPV